MPSGSKFIPSIDFGFVRLEINDALVANSGLLKVTATNMTGSASSSGTLKILPETSGPVTSSLHPSGKTGIEAIEKMESSVGMKLRDGPGESGASEKPHFVSDLQPEFQVFGEEPLQLDCMVEPKTDPYCRIKPDPSDEDGLIYMLHILDLDKCGVLVKNVRKSCRVIMVV